MQGRKFVNSARGVRRVVVKACDGAFIEALEGRRMMSAVVYGGPITITAGGTYTGNWESTNANVAAVTIDTTAAVVIVNSNLEGPGNLIEADGASTSNVTVLNSTGLAVNPNINGRTKGAFLDILNATKVDVEHCFIQGVRYGIFVNHYGGDHTANDSIKVLYNSVHDMDARYSNGAGGYQNTGADDGHFVILDNVHGVAGMEIGWNQIINDPGATLVEENINVYFSSGTAASPILIHDNYIQGAFGPAGDPNGYNGGGIITDGGPTTDPTYTTAFVDIYNNQITRSGNGAISISTGHDISVHNNRVVSAGILPDGTSYTSGSATGIVAWDPNGNIANGTFYNNVVSNNVSGLLRTNGNGGLQRSDYWMPVGSGGGTGNVSLASDPTLANEAAEYTAFLAKVASNNVTIGVSGAVTVPVNTPPAGTGTGPVIPAPVETGGVIQIEAENYDTGGEGVGYHDLDAANLGGAYRPADGVDIQATTDAGGGYDVGWTEGGEWMNYTFNVATAGTYSLGMRVASMGSGGKFHVVIDGGTVSSQSIGNTGGWQNWMTLNQAGISLSAGKHVMKVVMDTNGASGYVGNFNWLKLTQSGAIQIEAEAFDKGGEGVAYHDTDPQNLGQQYDTADGVDIGVCGDTGGGFEVGWTHAGEWINYTFNVATAGTYELDTRVASYGSGGKFHFTVDGASVTGELTAPNTGGWQTYQTVAAGGVKLSAGTHVLRFLMDANGQYGYVGNFNWFRFVQTS